MEEPRHACSRAGLMKGGGAGGGARKSAKVAAKIGVFFRAFSPNPKTAYRVTHCEPVALTLLRPLKPILQFPQSRSACEICVINSLKITSLRTISNFCHQTCPRGGCSSEDQKKLARRGRGRYHRRVEYIYETLFLFFVCGVGGTDAQPPCRDACTCAG